MVSLARTWVSSIDINVTESSQNAQFQELFYELLQTFILAGWTIPMSNNGTTYSNSSNVITSPSLVGLGATGTGAWFVARSPSGWLPSAGQIDLLIGVNDVGTPANVLFVRVLRNGIYNTATGSTTTTPTPLGGNETSPTIPFFTTGIGQTITFDARAARWYTSRGDVFFGIRGSGTAGFQQFLAVCSNVDGSGGGYGGNRFWIFGISSLTVNDQISWATLGGTGPWFACTGDGISSLGTTLSKSVADDLPTWTAGAEAVGGIPAFDIDMAANLGGSSARFFGKFVDVYGAPEAATPGTVQDGDTDTYRLVCIGALWMPVLASSLPFP